MTVKLAIPGINDENILICISRATRTFGQYIKAVEDALAHKCPFCQIDRNYNKVVLENELWMSWFARPAEKNTRIHLLIVPKRHVKDTAELTNEEKLGLFSMIQILQGIYRFPSYGLLIRNGDATLSAGTIPHLHVHVMVPNGTGRVESPFFKGKEADEESMARACVFEKIRQGIGIGCLTETERKLVKGRLDLK